MSEALEDDAGKVTVTLVWGEVKFVQMALAILSVVPRLYFQQRTHVRYDCLHERALFLGPGRCLPSGGYLEPALTKASTKQETVVDFDARSGGLITLEGGMTSLLIC